MNFNNLNGFFKNVSGYSLYLNFVPFMKYPG